MTDLPGDLRIYQKLGWSIFPLHSVDVGRCTCGREDCERRGKHPLTEHGFKDASKDPSVWSEWASRWPFCNWGAPTGEINGFDVLDADSADAVEWASAHGLAEAPRVSTGKGAHFYVQHIPGARDWAKRIPGCDFRGDGGYVVIPPSRHVSGRLYAWANGVVRPIAAPDWLIDACKGTAPSPPSSSRLSRSVDSSEKVPRGRRNHFLVSEAGRLRALGLSKEAVLTALREINETRCDPPVADREVETIAAWVATKPGVNSLSVRSYDLTELGNADRLLDRFGADLRYDVHRDIWLIWDGRRWAVDETGQAHRWMEAVVGSIQQEAEELTDEADKKRRAQVSAWWHASSTNFKIEAALSVARHRDGVPVRAEDLDRNPWLLTCLNGTVDLRSGELRPHRREELITSLSPFDYDPSAECPEWLGFLRFITKEDEELSGFLQRAVGYSLTGSTREQAFFILYGTGRNGKSTFLNAVRRIAGDNARNTEASTFLRQDGRTVRQDLAALRGARVVTTTEIRDGDLLDEELIKRLTGGDPITARWLYSRHEAEFVPTAKVWFAVNHKPRVWGQDEGIWRRLLLVPWEVAIPEESVDKDYALKLEAEARGILAWAVRGAIHYLKVGLQPPTRVRVATKDYRQESDFLADFLSDCTEASAGESVTVGDLYRCYSSWCKDLGLKPASATRLSLNLKERGFAQARTKASRYWSRLRLTEQGSSLVYRAPPREEWGRYHG